MNSDAEYMSFPLGSLDERFFGSVLLYQAFVLLLLVKMGRNQVDRIDNNT